MVIGADVPVSKTGAPLGGNPTRRKGQKNRSPPAGNVDLLRAIFGASREEAPEEVSVSCAMRHQNLPSGRRRAKQDAMSGCPKKGRRRGAADRFSGCKSWELVSQFPRSGRLSWCARIEERLAFGPAS